MVDTGCWAGHGARPHKCGKITHTRAPARRLCLNFLRERGEKAPARPILRSEFADAVAAAEKVESVQQIYDGES